MSRTPTTLLQAFGQKPVQTPPQVFTGTQRQRILTLIAEAIQEGRQVDVLRAVEKDPSLMFEDIKKSAAGFDVFPKACLRAGMPSGYLLALSHGFDVNSASVSRPGWSDLLYCAVSEGKLSDVTLLLALGASPNLLPTSELSLSSENKSREPCPSLMSCAIDQWAASFNANTSRLPTLPYCLLDAGLEIAANDSYAYFHSLVTLVDWKADGALPVVSKLMARLKKAGADIDAAPGSRVQSALSLAIGTANGNATEVLVLLGADVTVKKQGDQDIFDRMRANNLEAFIPKVQAHMMTRTIQSARSESTETSESASPAPEPHATARRRAGARL